MCCCLQPNILNYSATIITFCVTLWASKSSSRLMPPPQQLASPPAFSPLSEKSPGRPPASSSASSSATPNGLLTFQQPGARSRTAPCTTSPPSTAGSYFILPHKQLQILFPFRWFPSHSAQAIFLITQPSKWKRWPLSVTRWTISQCKRCKTNSSSSRDTAGFKLAFTS